MRKTIRHVAVLAAASVMLPAIAVPAQGEQESTPRQIDAYCVGPCEPDAWAWDDGKTYRRLTVYLDHANGPTELEVDEGRGLLTVQHESLTDHEDVYLLLEHREGKRGFGVIDSVYCAVSPWGSWDCFD